MSNTPEVRGFTMHPNLLRDVIERQAGTVDKAVLEQVMNLIEAGATRGDITVTPKRIVVKDDGKGFESREEILAAFEVFGKSDERKAEEKRWAKYQMGRGQAMAFGRTTYRTRTFRMYVDIRDKELGLGYVLEENLPDIPGCTVTLDLYDELDSHTLTRMTRAITDQVKYVDTPIYIGKKRINLDPKTDKWDLETEDAYFKFSEHASSIAIYNLGVYVRNYQLGTTGGIAVSKRQLDVNFARNDVIKSCPVYKAIISKYRLKSEKLLLDRRTFKPEHVLELLAGIESGVYLPRQVNNLKIWRTATGKYLETYRVKGFDLVAFDRKDAVLAERAMQQKPCIILDQDYFAEIFGVSDPDALYTEIDALSAKLDSYRHKFPEFVETSVLYEDINTENTFIPDSKLSKEEQLALHVLRKNRGHGVYDTGDPENYSAYDNRTTALSARRDIKIGESMTARAWTDGANYIGISRDTFKALIKTLDGWSELMMIIAHEHAHTNAERVHDSDFYERFHENAFATCKYVSRTFRDFTRQRIKAGMPVREANTVTMVEKVHGSVFDDADAIDLETDQSTANIAPEPDSTLDIEPIVDSTSKPALLEQPTLGLILSA
jgi:hypothetical protein